MKLWLQYLWVQEKFQIPVWVNHGFSLHKWKNIMLEEPRCELRRAAGGHVGGGRSSDFEVGTSQAG